MLGTGFYNKCSYVDAQKQFKSAPTRFIQEATMESLGVEKWSERDAVYIFTTEKARQENWDKTSQVRGRRRTIHTIGTSTRRKALCGQD